MKNCNKTGKVDGAHFDCLKKNSTILFASALVLSLSLTQEEIMDPNKLTQYAPYLFMTITIFLQLKTFCSLPLSTVKSPIEPPSPYTIFCWFRHKIPEFILVAIWCDCQYISYLWYGEWILEISVNWRYKQCLHVIVTSVPWLSYLFRSLLHFQETAHIPPPSQQGLFLRFYNISPFNLLSLGLNEYQCFSPTRSPHDLSYASR